MRRMTLAAALLLAPTLAIAQPVPQQLQAQMNAAQAEVQRIMVGLTNQIAADQAEIATLRQQLAEAKKPVPPGKPK